MFRQTKTKVHPYNSKNQKDIFRSLRYFNFLTKIFMSAPFSVSGPVGEREFTPIKNYDIIYISRCFIVCGVMFYALCLYAKWGTKLRIAQGTLNSFTLVSIITWTFLRKGEVIRILRKFEKKEKFLKEIGIAYSYSRLRIFSFVQIIIVFSISCVTSVFVINEYDDTRGMIVFLLYIFPNIIIKLYVCQYINYVLILNDWLANLLVHIEEMFHSDHELAIRLSYARQTFYSVWRLSDMVQKYFQFPVLLIKATSFLNTTAFMYLWLISNHIYVSTYLWIASNLLKLFVLPYVCELCCDKASQVSVALKKLATIRFAKMNDTDENILDFAMLLSHKKIHFNVCGMFKIDLEFVFATMAAVTIYVVIFKQNNVMNE